MKIRIGFGLGVRTPVNGRDTLGPLVDGLEERGFDSLWFSERLGGDAPDPIAAMAFTVGRTTHLKVGTSVLVLPGRNLAVLAKELATIDQLAGGRNRVLPAFGLGVADPHEQAAFAVAREDRGAMFDEALPLLRRLWSEDHVTHEGTFYRYDAITIRPKPILEHFDVWFGGMARSELRRIGRLGDGWLPSFCTPDDVRDALPLINDTASEHGRVVDPEHVGALIAYRPPGEMPELLAKIVASRRPGIDPELIVPAGLDGVAAQIERFVAVGASKFVVLPVAEPADADALLRELDAIAATLLPLQT